MNIVADLELLKYYTCMLFYARKSHDKSELDNLSH